MALARAKECFQQEDRQNKAMEVDMAQAKALEDQVKWFNQQMESLPLEETGMDGVYIPALFEEIEKQVNDCRMQMPVVMHSDMDPT